MLLFPLLSTMTLALPNGAPGCSTPTQAMSSTTQNLGYKITKTITKPGEWIIKISGCRPAFQGLLMWVSGDDESHVGEFVFKNKTKWQYKSVSDCLQKGVKTSKYGTVTHRVPDKVVAQNVEFRWICPAGVDLSKLKIYAVVADKDRVNDKVPVWQSLNPVNIVGNGTEKGSVVGDNSTVVPVVDGPNKSPPINNTQQPATGNDTLSGGSSYSPANTVTTDPATITISPPPKDPSTNEPVKSGARVDPFIGLLTMVFII